MNKGFVYVTFIQLLLVGCEGKVYNPPSSVTELTDSISIEDYKRITVWVELDDVKEINIKTHFNNLGITNHTYEDAKNIHGTPVLEYTDTVVHGINVNSRKPDFDLYPLTMDRDTVIVQRCWWYKSYHTGEALYIVFDRSNDKTTPIYGYSYYARGLW